MTAAALLRFDFDAIFGSHAASHTFRRDRSETDSMFLTRVVASHQWATDDTLELWADNGRLASAEITVQGARPRRASEVHQPTPALRNAAQHLLIVGYGSLFAVMCGELQPTEFRASCRCRADESSDEFFSRLAWEIIMPLKARYEGLKVRTRTTTEANSRRSTTHLIASLN